MSLSPEWHWLLIKMGQGSEYKRNLLIQMKMWQGQLFPQLQYTGNYPKTSNLQQPTFSFLAHESTSQLSQALRFRVGSCLLHMSPLVPRPLEQQILRTHPHTGWLQQQERSPTTEALPPASALLKVHGLAWVMRPCPTFSGPWQPPRQSLGKEMGTWY